MELANGLNRVPFGRTEVLIGTNDAPSPELSHWRRLKGVNFRRVYESLVFMIN